MKKSCVSIVKRGHVVKSCQTLEKRNSAICYNCNGKGHFAKNCKSELKKEKTPTVACMGLASFVNPGHRNIDRDMWVLDSTCNAHVCNNRLYFESLEPVNADILVGDDKMLIIDSIGKVKCRHGSCNLLFRDVLLNVNSPVNLISVFKLLRSGWVVKELNLKFFGLQKDSFTISASLYECNLWVVDDIEVVASSSCILLTIVNLSLVERHQRFTHQNFDYTRDLLNRLEVKYKRLPKEYKCVECVKGKSSIAPFGKSEFVASEVGELTHADLLLSPTLSLGGSKYALCLKDDFSKYRTVYFLKIKPDSLDCFRDYFTRIRTQTGNNPKRLRMDNGTEEVNADINDLTSSLGMIHELTCPFSPQQNGRIERDMRTLLEAVTTVLIDSKLKQTFWAEALSYVVYTLNRVSKSSIDGKTPFELYYNRDAFDVSSLRKEKRKKFNAKGEEGIFVGYQLHTKGYKVYKPETRTFEVSRNVVFLKNSNESSDDLIDSGQTDKQEEQTEAEGQKERLVGEDFEVVEMEYEYDWDSEPEVEETVSAVSLFN